MNRFQYLIVMGLCLLGTLPLEFAFDAKVYRHPRRLFATLAIVAIPMFAWDAVAIARKHWWFSARYTTGWSLPASVPIEEVAFFIVIPVCSLLTHGAVRTILRRSYG